MNVDWLSQVLFADWCQKLLPVCVWKLSQEGFILAKLSTTGMSDSESCDRSQVVLS